MALGISPCDIPLMNSVNMGLLKLGWMAGLNCFRVAPSWWRYGWMLLAKYMAMKGNFK